MLSNYKKSIDKALDAYLAALPNYPIYEPIRYIVNLGGKRFRSSLTLMISELFCGNPLLAINEAMAIELFHNFTLIHDDIMDEASLRRGCETVHKKWSNNEAILSGDLLYALVNKLLAISEVTSSEIQTIFHQTAIEVCEGQAMDMDFEKRSDVSIDEYLLMIKLKTAVLVACALKIGALIGGAKDSDANQLYEFGINLGVAFQIHDDILDVYPSHSSFGKKVGGDIIEEKKTLLYISLLNSASKSEIDQLNTLYSSKEENSEEIISEVKKMYEKYDVLSVANKVKDKYHLAALSNIENLSIDQSNKNRLISFAQDLMSRNF
tara:strand:+ start:1458 stop:2423 length:966 start_codon:yes stop_codon:yes gene_type:complete